MVNCRFITELVTTVVVILAVLINFPESDGAVVKTDSPRGTQDEGDADSPSLRKPLTSDEILLHENDPRALNVTAAGGVVSDVDDEATVEDEPDMFNQSELGYATTASKLVTSPGNLIYSMWGFILGGVLLFMNLNDSFKGPIINGVNSIFGRREHRRRRSAAEGLEYYVGAAFDMLTTAIDKMEKFSNTS
ncbi:uncharacterized protein [Cherax quadricarinatus]|uniref:uncharacterized protein n=1 Tax=Cherax quadricarinatus TaxID=27406 RepID=UPI00387E8430